MTNGSLKENQSLVRGCLAGGIVLSVAFVLMAGTIGVLHHRDHFSCFGQLGAGFPVAFLCDYSGGGSPISSMGKIDTADFPYFSPIGTFVDVLFYSLQLGMIWLIANSLSRAGPLGRGKYRWAVWIIAIYLTGFFSALLLFLPAGVRIERSFPTTPTPAASPTTVRIYPAPASTPSPTTPPQ